MALAGTSEGRREVKRSETRHALREAALARFLAHGVADARVADIAADCGVSERTFFRYFPTKEHAALDGLETWLQQLISAFEELPDSYGPIAALDAVFAQARAGRFPFGADQVRSAIAYESFPEVQATFAGIVEAQRLRTVADIARRSGTDLYDPYARVLGSVLTSGLFAVMESWLHGGRGDDPWDLVAETLGRVARDVVDLGPAEADRST